MLDTLLGAGFFQETDGDGEVVSDRTEPDTEIPSSMTLQLDEDGAPVLARFTYVDEDTCIGCRNCAYVARSTFFMEDSFAGKARVYNQGGDSDDLIEEAIDTCPVNCIHYVSHEDLVTLEQEVCARACTAAPECLPHPARTHRSSRVLPASTHRAHTP